MSYTDHARLCQPLILRPKRLALKKPSYVKMLLSDIFFFGGFVVSLGRFLDQAHPYGLGRDPDSAHFSVDQGPYFLNIRLEFALGDAGNLSADTA